MNNDDRRRELEAKKAKLEEFKRRKIERQNNNSLNQQKENDLVYDCSSSTRSINVDDLEKIFNEIELKKENDKKFEKIFIKTIENEKKKNLDKLSINTPNLVAIPSKEIIMYSKETQTNATTFDINQEAGPMTTHSSPKLLDKVLNKQQKLSNHKQLLPLECYEGPFIYDTLQWEDEFHSSLNHSSFDVSHQFSTASDITSTDYDVDDELAACLHSLANNKKDVATATDNEIKEIKIETDGEKLKRMFESKDFLEFLTKKSSIIEKALNQEDIFYDYGTNFENKENEFCNGEALKICREFSDEKCKNRIVTALDWSLHYPELLLASYESSLHESNEGVALIWNLKFEKSTPEYTFNCSSWVTSCCFNNFHSSLIIGATYSGQIVMWDTRSNKHTPIQRSSLAIASHTNPVYCTKIIGSQSSNNLLSISNDGRLCVWALENMNLPIETVDLHVKQTSNVPVTCLDFQPTHDMNSILVGTEDAYVYKIPRHGNKTGVVNETFEGHYGPITSISLNQAVDPIDYSNIFLTSSFDWSIKLWNMKEPSTPIYSFEDNNDYVYDVAWSPIHPSLFASVDGEGRLDLWNLINDSEIPTASICFNNGQSALNKLKWTKCGNKIAIGDDLGKVSIVDVNENISRPKVDDSKKLTNTLNELKQNYIDLQEIHGINKSISYF